MSGAGSILATSSWDRSICLWDTERLLAVPSSATSTGGYASITAVPSDAVRDRISVGKVPTGLSTAPSGQLLATSHTDGTARVWDPRGQSAASKASDKSGAAVVMRHRGLPWVSAVAWHPTDRHLVLSASHDGACRVWDVRAAKAPLYAMKHSWSNEPSEAGGAGAPSEDAGSASTPMATGDSAMKSPPKLLACAWGNTRTAVSGGEDRRLVTWGMRGRSLETD